MWMLSSADYGCNVKAELKVHLFTQKYLTQCMLAGGGSQFAIQAAVSNENNLLGYNKHI